MAYKEYYRRIIRKILMILIIITSCLLIYFYFGPKPAKEYAYVDDYLAIPEPIQEQASGKAEFKANFTNVQIKYLYSYKISGRVVFSFRYFPTTVYGALAPIDVGISWGTLSADENMEKLTFVNLGDRGLRMTYKDNKWASENSDILFDWSHNHLVPSNKTIKKLFRQIKRGDYISIEGYLIEAKWKYLGINSTLTSSTVRNDTGKHACEVIYVTDIKWLKENE